MIRFAMNEEKNDGNCGRERKRGENEQKTDKTQKRTNKGGGSETLG